MLLINQQVFPLIPDPSQTLPNLLQLQSATLPRKVLNFALKCFQITSKLFKLCLLRANLILQLVSSGREIRVHLDNLDRHEFVHLSFVLELDLF